MTMSNAGTTSTIESPALPAENEVELRTDAAESGELGVESPAELSGVESEAALVSDAEPVAEAALVGQGDLLSDDELFQGVAALIFAAPEPLGEKRLAALLEGPRPERIRAAVELVRARLAESGLPLELRALSGGYQILSAPALGEVVQRLFKARKAERVSAAALETLSVVAYRQPVTKAEIEAIRGVQAGPILRTLIDRGFVRVAGRADVPGHPLQYGTTKLFLDRFGLEGIGDLPRDGELARD